MEGQTARADPRHRPARRDADDRGIRLDLSGERAPRPYCDGWEHRDERIAVYAPRFGGSHLGRLLRQWSGDVVVLTNGGPGVDADDEDALAEVGVPVLRESVERFVASEGKLTAVELIGRGTLARGRPVLPCRLQGAH